MMNLLRRIERLINGYRRNPFDQQQTIRWLIENDSEIKPEELEYVYGSPAYKANGKYWQNIQSIFTNHEYRKIRSLPKEIIWGEDDFDDKRLVAYIYLLIFKNKTIQVSVELSQGGIYADADDFTDARIAIKETIDEDQIRFFNTTHKIFPYE